MIVFQLLCYNPHVVEANPPTPPQENPYGYGKEYVYREAKRKGYYHPEIAASFTFTFDRATEETFLGTYYQIVPNSDKKVWKPNLSSSQHGAHGEDIGKTKPEGPL